MHKNKLKSSKKKEKAPGLIPSAWWWKTNLHCRGLGAQLLHLVTGEDGHHAGRVLVPVALRDGDELTTAVHHLP